MEMPNVFFDPKMKYGYAFKLLIAFIEAIVPSTSADGIVRRYYDESETDRKAYLKKYGIRKMVCP